MESVPQRTLFSPQYFKSLPSACAAAFRVAHQVAPSAAKFGINVTVRRYSVLDERADQGIDAIIRAPALEGAFGNAW